MNWIKPTILLSTSLLLISASAVFSQEQPRQNSSPFNVREGHRYQASLYRYSDWQETNKNQIVQRRLARKDQEANEEQSESEEKSRGEIWREENTWQDDWREEHTPQYNQDSGEREDSEEEASAQSNTGESPTEDDPITEKVQWVTTVKQIQPDGSLRLSIRIKRYLFEMNNVSSFGTISYASHPRSMNPSQPGKFRSAFNKIIDKSIPVEVRPDGTVKIPFEDLPFLKRARVTLGNHSKGTYLKDHIFTTSYLENMIKQGWIRQSPSFRKNKSASPAKKRAENEDPSGTPNEWSGRIELAPFPGVEAHGTIQITAGKQNKNLKDPYKHFLLDGNFQVPDTKKIDDAPSKKPGNMVIDQDKNLIRYYQIRLKQTGKRPVSEEENDQPRNTREAKYDHIDQGKTWAGDLNIQFRRRPVQNEK